MSTRESHGFSRGRDVNSISKYLWEQKSLNFRGWSDIDFRAWDGV